MEGRPEHGERPAQGKAGGQGEGQEPTQPRPTAAAIAAQAASASPEEEPSKLPPASPASGSGQATDGPAPPVKTGDKRPRQEDLTAAAATPAPSVQPEQQKPPSTAHPAAASPPSSADLEARDHSPALHESPRVLAVPPAGPHATPTLASEQAGGTKGKETTGGAPPASQPQPPPVSAADSSATGASTSHPVTPSGVGGTAKEGKGQVPPQSSSTLPAPAVQPEAAPVLAASASTASTDKPLTATQQTTSSSATDLYSTAAGELYTTAVAGSTDSLARTDSSPAAATATAGLGGEKEDSSSVEEAALAALVGRQVLVPVEDEDGGGERLPARVVGYDTATRRLRVVYDDDPDVQDDVDVRSVIVTNRPSTAQGEGDGHGMAPAGSAPPVVQAPPQHGQQKQQETATEPTKGDKAARPGDAAALQAREARLSALVGRAVSVRLPADEEGGEEEELLPAQIVGYDAARNMVRVRYDDDPDTAEDMPVDSPDLVIADTTTQAPTIINKPPTGPAAPLVVEKPQQAAPPPEGEACIGWTVRVDLGDGMSELGQVVGYNKASGALVVSFPTLDAEEECNRAELTFLAKY